jgi:catechol 2,3-dioxygenase-like lactoylglutathione lyase family enzyme
VTSAPSRLQAGIVPVDLGASVVFYRDVLGLPYQGTRPALEGRTLHLFTAGDSVLKLLETPETPEAPSARAPGGPFADATGIRWLTLDVGDLDAIVSRCVRAGVHLQLAPTDLRPGLRVAIAEDPAGNAIELVERTTA